MNGLATDLQMFALKTLRIPLPGRHPPSAILSDGSGSSRYCALMLCYIEDIFYEDKTLVFLKQKTTKHLYLIAFLIGPYLVNYSIAVYSLPISI